MITIDESRSYPHPTEEEWESFKTQDIYIRDIVLSQAHTSAVAYLAVLAYSKDQAPPIRCVEYNGKLHLHDGQHRVLIALARDQDYVSGKLYSPIV